MTHGDDDGLRVPPAIAPQQVVILPMLRDNEGDAALLDYCEALRGRDLARQTALDETVRVLLDTRPGKAAAKRWDWVRKGAPVIIEVGPRDMDAGTVSLLRRDQLWGADGKPAFQTPARETVGAGDRRRCSRRSSSACSPRRRNGATPTSSATSTASTRWPRSSARTSAIRAGSKCSGRSRPAPRSTRWSSGSRRSS